MTTADRRVPAGALCLLVGTLLWAIIAVPVMAQGGQPDAIPVRPWPGDHIFISTVEGGCPALSLDSERPPRARQIEYMPSPSGQPNQDVYRHEVTYWTTSLPDQICPAVPVPTFLTYRVDLGPLPIGRHEFRVTEVKDGVPVNVRTVMRTVMEYPSAPAEISGAWYTPEQSGRGVLVLRQEGLTGVWWSMHDAEGQPFWVVMIDADARYAPRLEGEAFTTVGSPLSPLPAQLSNQRWGNLMFTYQGCGRARLQWQADDPTIGGGELDLVQLMVPDGIQRCSPKPGLPIVQAIWEA